MIIIEFVQSVLYIYTIIHDILSRGGTQVMLVYASGQCMEQRSCACLQWWHSAPPGMVVGLL